MLTKPTTMKGFKENRDRSIKSESAQTSLLLLSMICITNGYNCERVRPINWQATDTAIRGVESSYKVTYTCVEKKR